MSGPPRRIGYLLTLFPKVSETFVLGEVVSLQRRGVDLVPICLDRSRRVEPTVHETARALKQSVRYVLDAFPGGHVRAFSWWALRRPLGLARLFAQNLRHPAPRGESKLGRFSNTVYCAWLVRRLRIDHLHAHWSYPCDVALLLSRFLPITFSFTAHAHDIFEDIPLYSRAGFGFHERLRPASFVVTCTAYNRAHLQELCPYAERPKLHHAYHGLDLAKFARGERAATAGEIPTLISVGRFVPYKGFDVVTRACERLVRSGRGLRCLLVGPDGSQTPVVREQVRQARLDGVVELLGPRSQEELVELYRSADVYVNASDPDGEYGVANVIVEALAMELPTVVTRRPQVQEYIEDGVNGLVVPYGDDAALAEAIERLLEDGALRERLGQAGRAVVSERFDIEATTNRLAGLLEGATGSSRCEREEGRR